MTMRRSGQLFPRQAKEVMERELIHRKGLRELMEKPEILERIESNQELVKTLLTHRDLMNEIDSASRKLLVDHLYFHAIPACAISLTWFTSSRSARPS